ncbi:MAG: hypothetical protein JWO24_779 [Rhodospirillales bacterium]|nr:hypothetical protein [Rhodospirillales bacterium]
MAASPALNDQPVTRQERTASEPLTYTLQAAAAASGLSTCTLRRREKEGLLRFHRVGGRTLVPAASLRELLGMAT